MHKILFFVVFLLLAGCASIAEQQNALVSSTMPVTQSFEQMKAADIAQAKELTVELGKDSPTFMFEEGKSFYAAFTLPNAPTPRKLKVKSFYSTSYLPNATIFYPYFLFLDNTKKPIGSEKKIRLEQTMDLWAGEFYSGEIVVPAEARSIVIYTSDSPAPSLISTSANGTERILPHAPGGKISLELSTPYPAGYNFSKAVIKDSVESSDSKEGDFFYVSHIDDKQIENAQNRTLRLNAGRGFYMTPYEVEREVSVNSAKYTLVGRTVYAAPILALTNPVYEVKGQVETTLEQDKVYVVRGELRADYAAVWLEEAETHKIVGNKIEVHGSPAVGILSK